MSNKPKLLMAVGNDIAFDGRVQRSIDALSADFDITLVCYSNKKYERNDCKIVSVKFPNFKEFRGIKRLIVPFFHLYFLSIIIFNAIRVKPHIFYGHDFFMALPGYLIKKIFNIFFVYDAHELIIPDKKFEQRKEVAFWYQLEKLAIRKADLIISANEERAKLMKEHYTLRDMPAIFRNISPVKIANIELPKEFKDFFAKKKKEDLYIIYQGVMDIDRGISDFIKAMRFLGDNFKLVLVGYGKDYDKIKHLINQEVLFEKVFAFDRVPRELLPIIIKHCDVGIVSYNNLSLNEVYCEPNKLYDYAQMGLCIVATCQINLKKIIEKYKIGVVVGCDNSKNLIYEIKEAFENVFSNYSYYKDNIKRFLEDYNWDYEKNNLKNAIKKAYFKERGM